MIKTVYDHIHELEMSVGTFAIDSVALVESNLKFQTVQV